MQGSIIKATIKLDKEAREKIAALKEEKEHLDDLLKNESDELHNAYLKENKKILKDRQNAYQLEIKTRQEKELNTYTKALDDLQKQYKENKEKWIEDIYEACIK
jgi:V/A-type H+/Na+-transporting ATPase subunit G/H